jgi:hypothetical protein
MSDITKNDCQGEGELPPLTSEEVARIERAKRVWLHWKDVTIEGHKFTHIQESHVLNMLFRMQEAEHEHFGIDIMQGASDD